MLQLKKLIQFQGCWFAIIFGQVYGWEWQGFLVAGLLFLWCLLEDKLWRKEFMFTFGLGFVGWLVDCLLVRVGLFSFPYFVGNFAPYWMIALWGSFSLGLEDFYEFSKNAYSQTKLTRRLT